MKRPSLSRRFLRRATRLEHAAAENTPVMRALLGEQLGRANYIGLLQGYHALYSAWEKKHAAWLLDSLIFSGWRYRTRLSSIESDLQDLGAQPLAQVEKNAESRSTGKDSTTDSPGDAASWGSLYVIEGSTLGGQIIARHLSVEFPGHPHRFFNLGHGKGLSTWKDFQTAIEGHLLDAPTRRVVAVQARVMFGLFQNMLNDVQ